MTYGYMGGVYHDPCLIELLIEDDMAAPAARDLDVATALDQIESAGEFSDIAPQNAPTVTDEPGLCFRCGQVL